MLQVNGFMNLKKQHEVELLTKFVKYSAHSNNIQLIGLFIWIIIKYRYSELSLIRPWRDCSKTVELNNGWIIKKF